MSSVTLLRKFVQDLLCCSQAYYTALAQDTILQLGQYADPDNRVVADIGGGPRMLDTARPGCLPWQWAHEGASGSAGRT